MSVQAIQRALELRLDAMLPKLDTAWENGSYVPNASAAYQKVNHMRAQPDNPCAASVFVRETGFMQVTLLYPQNGGAKDAVARAEAIKAQFTRGLSLTNGGVVVTISNTPYVMPGSVDGDRWSVPVRIPYFANI